MSHLGRQLLIRIFGVLALGSSVCVAILNTA